MAWYAKFDGIDGSALHKDHKGWINVSHCEHEGEQGRRGRHRRGTRWRQDAPRRHLARHHHRQGAARSCSKAAVKGQVFKKVEIHGTATYGNAGEQVYLAVELENVQITNYQLGVLDNDAATDDLSLSLNFEKYKTTFTAYSKEGKSEGKVEHEWKVEEGE